MAVNINDLELTPESIPEIDFDAPEQGSFSPQLTPGAYEFAFTLADDPYSTMEVNGHKYLQVNFSAITDKEGQEVTLNFQRASSYQSPAMKKMGMLSRLGDLLRSLGIRIEGQQTPSRIADVLNEASNQRKHFRGQVEWRRYCKADETTIATAPRKKRGDIAWPKAADGGYELAVACPKCGEKAYGQAEINRYLSANSGKQVESQAHAGIIV